jgi:hypothetical protein
MMTVTKIHNNQNEAKSQEKKQHQNNTIDLKKKKQCGISLANLRLLQILSENIIHTCQPACALTKFIK